MKYNIVFKFIAVLLCAVSLLGIVGAALGITAMTEMNLYNKTVDQVIDERIQGEGGYIARGIAARYASMTLGGCPEQIAFRRFPNQAGFLNTYGYTLLDSEGNVLDSDELTATGKNVKTYTFDVEGSYMHLISTREEAVTTMPAPILEPEAYTLYSPDGQTRLYSGIPEGGAPFFTLTIGCTDGSVYDHWSPTPSGVVYRNENGSFSCTITNLNLPLPSEQEEISYIHLLDQNGTLLFEATSLEPVGTLTYYGGAPTFVTTLEWAETEPLATTPETIPETTAVTEPETIPPTQPETQPATQETEVTEETEAQETEEETQAQEDAEEKEHSSASDIPEETVVQETVAETSVPTEAPTEAPTEPVAESVPETEPAATESILINGKPLEEFEINKIDYVNDDHVEMVADYVYVPLPDYTLELHLTEDSLSYKESYELLDIVREYRQYLLPLLGASIAVFVIFAVYLCCAAGRKPKSPEVRPGGLNRIPLDLYFGAGFAAVMGLTIAASEGSIYLMRQSTTTLGLACAAGCAFAACLIIVGFLFACVAQFKTPDGFWYRNTLCGICIRLCLRFGVWLEAWLRGSCFPLLGRLLRKLWKLILACLIWTYRFTEKSLLWFGNLLGRFFHWSGRKLHRFLTLLPLTWQWLLGGCLIVFIAAIFINDYNSPNVVILGLVICLFIVLYAAHCFGLLAESTRRMSKGDLDTKVEDKLLLGCFQDFAENLNALADVAVVAAQKQLKSERMKTELITNVSHDIKTPLTSIINYVDLLQKPHTEAEGAQYLEVLDRQSQRLKKLIEDLMDMSKASTGNMSVEISRVDAVESVNQALGEFADKLDKARLTPVFRHTEESVPMMADGKLVWRVMSNLLGNAVKYAMPGTRLYVDLSRVEGKVVISLKNISREELNLDASELMERFVRGDGSRNTEGSGLGLNIAKSLMELQKGQLELLVDGDLFKVTLIFPEA